MTGAAIQATALAGLLATCVYVAGFVVLAVLCWTEGSER